MQPGRLLGIVVLAALATAVIAVFEEFGRGDGGSGEPAATAAVTYDPGMRGLFQRVGLLPTREEILRELDGDRAVVRAPEPASAPTQDTWQSPFAVVPPPEIVLPGADQPAAGDPSARRDGDDGGTAAGRSPGDIVPPPEVVLPAPEPPAAEEGPPASGDSGTISLEELAALAGGTEGGATPPDQPAPASREAPAVAAAAEPPPEVAPTEGTISLEELQRLAGAAPAPEAEPAQASPPARQARLPDDPPPLDGNRPGPSAARTAAPLPAPRPQSPGGEPAVDGSAVAPAGTVPESEATDVEIPAAETDSEAAGEVAPTEAAEPSETPAGEVELAALPPAEATTPPPPPAADTADAADTEPEAMPSAPAPSPAENAPLSTPAPLPGTDATAAEREANAAAEVAALSALEAGRPIYDMVRFEPSGEGLIAGRARPNARIELLANEKVIGTATAGRGGDWVVILDRSLEPGDYTLTVRATGPDTSEPVEAAADVALKLAGTDAPPEFRIVMRDDVPR